MMQDNKFNLGDILTHKKYGGIYRVIFTGDIDQVSNFITLEIIDFKGGHYTGGSGLPYFIRNLQLNTKDTKSYTWGDYENLKYYFELSYVNYTELAEMIHPDGYRDGGKWVIR
jgi:hypothetical protein